MKCEAYAQAFDGNAEHRDHLPLGASRQEKPHDDRVYLLSLLQAGE
jgi:hypothetical protein